MATKPANLIHVNEDYIDMELSSSSSSSASTSSNFFSYSIGSPPPQAREFEFQMTSVLSSEKDSTTSPADDLFYKGKLLPLHLPPRLQMVQNLIIGNSNSNNATFENVNKSYSSLEDSNFPFTAAADLITMPSTNASTPLESCNISPSESCRVSSEANPDEYLFGWSFTTSSDLNNGFVVVGDVGGDLPKKSWSKKLKQMKQFLLGQRLKASRAYLRSLFSKSGCSDKSCASAASNGGAEKKPRCKECQNKYIKVNRKNPFEIFDDDGNNNKHQISCAVLKTLKKEMLEDDFSSHRRSFSGVVQRHCGTKSMSLSTSSSGSSSSSSSFSFSSAGYYDLQLFKRSISANSELEGSIEGAIAHCKQSQQQQCGSKNSTTPGGDNSRICSQFASKVAVCGNQDMAALANTRG